MDTLLAFSKAHGRKYLRRPVSYHSKMIFNIVITVVAVVALAMAASIVLGIWLPWARHVNRNDFSDRIKEMLAMYGNGSFCRYDHTESDIWFSFERKSGTDSDAILAFRVGRRKRTDKIAADIRRAYVAHGFEYIEDDDNPSLLGEVVIPVVDIWDKACGAKGAHAARILLDELGLDIGAKFKLFERPTRRDRST